MTDPIPQATREIPEHERIGLSIITCAESYIRELASTGDLSKQRIRRRLKLAVAELTRMRQVFAANEGAESGEIKNSARMRRTLIGGPYGQSPVQYIGQVSSLLNNPDAALEAQVEAPVEGADTDIEGDAMRMQLPNPYETSTQRMIREVMSMAQPIVDVIMKQQEAMTLRAKVERADFVLGAITQAKLSEKEGDHERAKMFNDLAAKFDVDGDGPVPVMMPVPTIPPLPAGINDPIPHTCPVQGTWSTAYMDRLRAVEDGTSDICPCCQKLMRRVERPGIPAYVVCDVCPLQIGGAITNPADDPSVNLQSVGAPETDVPF